MNRTLTTLSLLGLCIASASAAAGAVRSVSPEMACRAATQQYTAMPPLARDPKRHRRAAERHRPRKALSSKEQIRGAGYSGVNMPVSRQRRHLARAGLQGPGTRGGVRPVRTLDRAGHSADFRSDWTANVPVMRVVRPTGLKVRRSAPSGAPDS